MADYRPETKVYLCEQVPLDDTYTDTLDFADKAAQAAYFTSKATHKYTNLSYQRVNNSIANPRAALTCRVPDLADNLYNCNYMMFQNNNFGTKWFYAFIKQVNYISPECTEIVYEIDYIQTWLFDFSVGVCYVEREHSATDEPFENILPEPIEISDFYEKGRYEQVFDKDVFYTLVSTKNPDGSKPDFNLYGGVMSAVYVYSSKFITDIKNKVNEFSDPENIITIFASRQIVEQGDRPTQGLINTGLNKTDIAFVYKNAKLLNSQFHYYRCVSQDGGEILLKPEKIPTNDETLIYKSFDASSLPPSTVYVPYYDTSDNKPNWNYYLSDTEIFIVLWTKDSFSSWWAQNGASVGSNIVATIGKIGIGLAAIAGAATPAGAAVGAVSTMTGLVKGAGIGASIYDASNAPDRPSASLSGNGVSFANKRPPFIIYDMVADNKSLKRADDFMTKFGYTVNISKVPNRKSRTRFNYIKVSFPIVTGSMPVEAYKIIKNALTNGITFWHDDKVGNYYDDNEVTGIIGW